MPARPLSTAGRVFAAVAFFEAFTWAGLLLGMVLKYSTQTTELGVWFFGRLHGLAFLVYVAVSLFAWMRLRWPPRAVVGAARQGLIERRRYRVTSLWNLAQPSTIVEKAVEAVVPRNLTALS